MDRNCPNVLDHGTDHHRLNQTTLIRQLKQQLSPKKLQPGTNLGCESLHVHGKRGALFKITLWSHGYTFVGKGAPREFVDGIKRERLTRIHVLPQSKGRSCPSVPWQLGTSPPALLRWPC